MSTSLLTIYIDRTIWEMNGMDVGCRRIYHRLVILCFADGIYRVCQKESSITSERNYLDGKKILDFRFLRPSTFNFYNGTVDTG